MADIPTEAKAMKPVFAIVALTLVVSPFALGQAKRKKANPNSYRIFDVHLHAVNPDLFREADSATNERY